MLITLEGIEGSGKTTQITYLYDFLKDRGLACIMTREPGGTRIGQKIRAVLLDPESHGMAPETELLLYVADRAEHIRSLILPALGTGKIVLCDRFFDATLVYQGFARGLDRQMIRQLHRLTCQGIRPDLTFLLDLDPDVGLKRAWTQIRNGSRTDAESRFEKEKLAFHERVRAGYLDLAKTEPDRFRIIEAGQAPMGVRAQIIAQLSQILKLH
jgi:dTMP kinase